jgi:hypothetical protein
LSVLPLVGSVLVRDRGVHRTEEDGTMLHPMTLLELAHQRTAEAERTATTRRLTRSAVAPDQVTTSDQLRPLLAAVAMLTPDDGPDWDALRTAAREQTTRLAADGALPRHLVVAGSDPAVVVTRTLATAWRHVTGARSG